MKISIKILKIKNTKENKNKKHKKTGTIILLRPRGSR